MIVYIKGGWEPQTSPLEASALTSAPLPLPTALCPPWGPLFLLSSCLRSQT